MENSDPPKLGVGLRSKHYPFLEKRPLTKIDWFEAISENYMNTSGRPLQILNMIRSDHPVALHGVGLSIGSPGSPPISYLQKLKDLVNKVEPFLVSDHLCFTGTIEGNTHDLLPFPYTEKKLKEVSEKVLQLQDHLQRPLTLENISFYLKFTQSEMSEADFFCELVKNTGCGLLLDINNVYVNSVNHGFDSFQMLKSYPLSAIKQIHLAGPAQMPGYLFDTHSTPVPPPVWTLLEQLLRHHQLPGASILLEWDEDIPSFEILESEVLKVHQHWPKRSSHVEARA